MSMLLRSILLMSIAGALIVGCGKKEEAVAPMESGAAMEAPAAEPAAEPAKEASTDAAPATGGGYEPTAEERVPGITEPAAQ